MNKVILTGNLGDDPRVHESKNGPIVALRLATNERWRDRDGQPQERTDWHRVVVFGKKAEFARDRLKKGFKVMVVGKLQTRSYEKDGKTNYITEVRCNEELELLVGTARNGGER